MRLRVCVFALAVLAGPSAALAQAPAAPPAEHDVSELAKKTQNPVSDLIAVPFQFNFNTGGDQGPATALNLNFQPVIPFKVTSGVSAILRTIMPIDSVPVGTDERQSGIGDIQEQLFFTSAHPGKLIWGVGPVFSLPTATIPALETGTWAGGVGGVVLTMHGPWVIGSLLSQFWPWSDAGGDPETNLFVWQPFVNYNLTRGYALSFAPTITANWNASSGNEWTVPLGIGITRTTVFNGRPMNIGVQYYYNTVRPTGSAGQSIRFVIAPLFPEK